MAIAKHNSGEIVEHEHHYKPITFGISLTKEIGKNWNVETGLQYSLLKSNFILGEGEYYIGRDQKFITWEYLLELPINGLIQKMVCLLLCRSSFEYTNKWKE